MCIFVFIGSIRDCYGITNNLIQSLDTSEGVTGLTDAVCADCSPSSSQYHYHLHLQSSQSDHNNIAPSLSDLLHLSYIPASESEEVMGNMKQHAADERVILVRADAPTPQLFNNTTTEAHSLTDNFDRSLFNPFHNFQRTSNHLIWMEKL